MDLAALLRKQVDAIIACDFEAFLADGDAYFRTLDKKNFDSVANQLAEALRTGYEIAYLGELKQQGYQVTLWKVSFKLGGDDLLATMYVKEGKVGGFLIK